MEEDDRFEGIYGVVEVKDGKVVKKVKWNVEVFLNREAIVYMRMKGRDEDIVICKIFDCIVYYNDYLLLYSSYVNSLIMEDVGVLLKGWITVGWFFDSIFVLFYFLLKVFEFLNRRGIV